MTNSTEEQVRMLMNFMADLEFRGLKGMPKCGLTWRSIGTLQTALSGFLRASHSGRSSRLS